MYKHCETSCKRDVTLHCNALKMRCRGRCEKYNLILLCAMVVATKMLRDLMIARYVIHFANLRVTWVVTKLRDKLRDKLQRLKARLY